MSDEELPDLNDEVYRGGSRPPWVPYVEGDFDYLVCGIRYSNGKDPKTKLLLKSGPCYYVTLKCLTSTNPEIRVGVKYTLQLKVTQTVTEVWKNQRINELLAACAKKEVTDPTFVPNTMRDLLVQATQSEQCEALDIRIHDRARNAPKKDDPTTVYTNHNWTPAG